MKDSNSLMTFCIPILPKSNAKDWGRVCELLSQTLASLEAQTRGEFRVLIATHDPDDLPPTGNLDVRLLKATWEVGDASAEKLRDKRRKKVLLFRELRELGGGYAMQLDADDLVSRRLVEYVLDTGDPHGYIIKTGYAYDWADRRLAPIPGVFSKPFDSVCGSCLIVHYELEDLPVKHDQDTDRLYYQLKQHAHYAEEMSSLGRPVEEVPFPAAVYVMNHEHNLHFSIATDRVTRIPRQIRKNEVEISPELKQEFTLPD
jgi:hypothetical protein